MILATSNTPANLYEAVDRRRVLLKTLKAHLTEAQYSVIVRLFGLEDGVERTYAQAARELGISTGAVHWARDSAMGVLRGVPGLREQLRDAVVTQRTFGVIHSNEGEG